uniref:Major facilitator superfamily (MFS) profile domain-containing protein n=1 Tax=Esox lucius TaxID=8010 RepID=A0A6Q2WSD8_ESOLU
METNGPVMSRQEGEKTHQSSASTRYGSVADSISAPEPEETTTVISSERAYVTVAILCYVNLINYMDRYTIAGVLLSIQNFFEIKDSMSGLLQTVFICSFIVLAPIFGYLGDRYNRKLIMIGGLTVWVAMTLTSSFVTKSYFWLLVLFRALVGTGEASYSTIAPTIIGDLFSGTKRTIMISAFYIFIPVGSGLGYIIGSYVASATGDWRWALRLNPILGSFGLLLLAVFCPNPSRGASEAHGGNRMQHTSYLEDIKYLLKNYVFGGLTVVTGILGVSLGSTISRRLRDRVPNADPLICAVGMLSSAPCFFAAIILASTSVPATYVFIGIGEILISLNWSILADILLYVVVPTRRATAEALQIMVCHLLGDAGSPYLIGTISDALRSQLNTHEWKFRSLEYSFLLCPFVGVLGGLFFLMTAVYITKDRKEAELLATGRYHQLT